MTDSGQFGRIPDHRFYHTTIRVEFDGVLIGFDFNFRFLIFYPLFKFSQFFHIFRIFGMTAKMVDAIFQSCLYQTQRKCKTML